MLLLWVDHIKKVHTNTRINMNYKLLCYKYLNQSFNFKDIELLEILPLSNLLELMKEASDIMGSGYVNTFISLIQVHNK